MGKLEGKYREVVNLYDAGKTTYEIGKIFGVSHEYIRQILIMCKINRRSISEINHNRFRKDKPISEELNQSITGWLLGDCGLHFTGKQAYFCLTSKHKEYIDYAKCKFNKENIRCRINRVFDKKYKKYAFKLFTESTIQFADLYNKWYIKSKKIVPQDFILSKETIKRWVMDDGTVSPTKGHLRLCTCAFSIEECERLSKDINIFVGNGRNSHVIEKNSKHPRIYCSKKDTNNLLNIIGQCDVDCFQYKWRNNLVCITGGASS